MSTKADRFDEEGQRMLDFYLKELEAAENLALQDHYKRTQREVANENAFHAALRKAMARGDDNDANGNK